jgi:isoquinoline 1-oxidoreductase beta subunit
MTDLHLFKRREFLKVGVAAGGGMLIGIYLPQLNASQTVSKTEVFQPNAFLRIGTDDIITVILGKSEMGTGIYTSLPMIAAEELDADWQHIRVEAAPVDEVYFHPTFHIQMTGGSSSVTSEWERLRKCRGDCQDHAHRRGCEKLGCRSEGLRDTDWLRRP